MAPPRILRIRYAVLALFITLMVWIHLPHPSRSDPSALSKLPSTPGAETLYLTNLMNSKHIAIDERESTSSFDWSTVKFKYTPPRKPELPVRARNASPLPKIQADFPENEGLRDSLMRNARRDEVRKTFQKSWKAYKEHAWMKDALKPISLQPVDQFAGWAATLVDSLDTLWIMGMKEEFDEAVQAVAGIDFGKAKSVTVNVFETNIRYLGGLLAAYDLSGHPVLEWKAIELGDLLLAGFNTENGMPVDMIDFERAKTGEGLAVEARVVSASPGTISLEFTRLSQITGNPKYFAAVSAVMDVFYENQNKTKLPGMWPMYVSMDRKDVTWNSQFSIGGNADSLFEYIPKAYALLGGAEPKYEVMGRTFMDTASRFLFFRPMVPDEDDILISGNVDVDDEGAQLDPESEHLSCFIGGLYALGGKLYSNEEYVETGKKLTKGCIYAYKSMPTGVMPERYNMIKCDYKDSCPWDDFHWHEQTKLRPQFKESLPLGFTTAKDPRYILRPEAMESVFVLWRITGDKYYEDAAWNMFSAIRNATNTEFAAGAVVDVTVEKELVKQEDYMESFWLAETLKYAYLAFSPSDLISLDEWVFNTEAHPFKLPR